VRYRPLGRTGLAVSALSLGTVSLGVEYGIADPGASGRPDEESAIALVRTAVERGVTLIDTAPAYGDAERIVGRAIGSDPRVIVATKTTADTRSLESSLRALGRDVLDIVQIHNATADLLRSGALVDTLLDARRRGVVRYLGATVYDAAAALTAIQTGAFDVLQVAMNLLDQRMRREVVPAAAAAGVGVVVRSAVLKGALTRRADWLPGALAPLKDAAVRARDEVADGSWERLAQVATRFCLSVPGIASVLSGPRTIAELDAALEAEASGPLDADVMARIDALSIEDDSLLNPSRWPAVP
jgi:aryl-alcohol dehydrogenase-like predicted oxidoreductase